MPPSEKQSKLLERIHSNDFTIFQEYSRWEIHMVKRYIDYTKLTREMDDYLTLLFDLCKESL